MNKHNAVQFQTFDGIFVPQMLDLDLMNPQQCLLGINIFCSPFALHDQEPILPFHLDPWHPMWLDCSALEQEH